MLRYGDVVARAHQAVLVPVIAWEPAGGDQADRVAFSDHLRKDCQDVACRKLRDTLVSVRGQVSS